MSLKVLSRSEAQNEAGHQWVAICDEYRRKSKIFIPHTDICDLEPDSDEFKKVILKRCLYMNNGFCRKANSTSGCLHIPSSQKTSQNIKIILCYK